MSKAMNLLKQLEAALDEGGLLTGADIAGRPADWRGGKPCAAKAIVRPRSALELSEIMKLCDAAGQPVVAAGGVTGLVGGQVASGDELLISFERMRAVEHLDPIGRTMTVEAGVALQTVHETAAEHDLIYGVDLGSRGSCTVGGNIATNAGGNAVLRYGMTRDNILGLEAVLADGTIVSSMNKLLKNNAGYDLKQLFIGTEGTLGLVTRAVLRLRPRPAGVATALVAFDDFATLTRFFSLAGQRCGSLLRSFEVMWNSFYQLVAADSGRHKPPIPPGHTIYAIVEIAGGDPERDEAVFTETLGEALEQGIAADVVIAASEAQRASIWAIREDIDGHRRMTDPGIAFDVSVPLGAMQEYVAHVTDRLGEACGPQSFMTAFGHLGDNNLHFKIAPRPWSVEAKRRAEELVYCPLAALGGSVSAEHGIGLDKREWLTLSRTGEEIALMRRLKSALDPRNVLNPGRII